jgi:hypothetical protein
LLLLLLLPAASASTAATNPASPMATRAVRPVVALRELPLAPRGVLLGRGLHLEEEEEEELSLVGGVLLGSRVE